MSIPSRALLRLGAGSQVGSQGSVCLEASDLPPPCVSLTEEWAMVMARRSWVTSRCGQLSILVEVPVLPIEAMLQI